ncbi:MAG: T9SS type A sorting domain-containing protein, partial [Bacteroidota bacterium]
VDAGLTYLLRLGGYGETAPGGAGTGFFTIQEFVPTLSNDFCNTATEVMIGTGQQFTNVGAITDGPLHPNDEGCFGFGDNTVQADIWYRFTAPFTGAVEWSTCDQINFDSRMAVYIDDAGCALSDEDLYACNDDGSGCMNFTSRLIFSVDEGVTYLLRLGGYTGEQGTGTFDLIETDPPIPPANDLCENADSAWIITQEQFDQLEGAIEGTTINGTIADISTFIFPNGQCYTANTTSGEFSTVWYELNSLGNTELIIWLFKEDDFQEAAYVVELFETCDQQVDSLAISGSCLDVSEDDVFVFTEVTNLPAEPTDYLIRVTTRLTTEVPGDFSLFIVGDSVFVPPVAVVEPFADEISVFPNPADTELLVNFSLNAQTRADLKIVNTLGQTVFLNRQQDLLAGENQLNVDVSDLSSGLYFPVLESEMGRSTMRVMIH